MVGLGEHTEVGSPMKVFLQPRVAHEFKTGSLDSPRSTASGEGSSNGIDSGVEYSMPHESMAGLSIDNGIHSLVSPEEYSEWQWNQAALCAQNYGFSGAGQYADLLIADFKPFVEPQFGGASGGVFVPCPPSQGISIKELYHQQQQQAFNSVADVCPEVLFASPLGGVRSDMSGEAIDLQGGMYSEFPTVEPPVADVALEMPLSLPFGSVTPDISGDAFKFQGSLYSELPSVGSAAHFEGWCKPCAFAYEGCINGKACEFCHVCPPGELKARKRAKLAQRRKMNRIAQQNSRWTGR
jgi:hypothetical protein